MNNEQFHRRKLIRLLSLSSVGVFTLSCFSSTSTENQQEISKEEQEKSLQKLEDLFRKEDLLLFQKSDPEFSTLQQGFNKDVPKTPALIALCFTTKGVQLAVKYAQQEQLKVTVKSGGHSFENFSSNNDGLQINLSQMTAMQLDENKVFTCQPGAVLKDVYDYILPKNRIVPMGSCGTVGLGGLTLGGGYGFFARKFGLTCDNLLQLTFVDGKGEIHEVQGNHELLKANKGGGNGNFGIVTEMSFTTHPSPAHFQQVKFKAFNLNLERSVSLFKSWFEWTKNLPETCFSAVVLNHKTMVVLVTNFGEDNQQLSEILENFKSVMDKSSFGTKKNLAASLKRYYGIQHPIYFKNASAGYYQDYKSLENCLEQVLQKVLETPKLIYQINTLGGKINAEEFKNSSTYPHRTSNYLGELQSYWETTQQGKHLKTAFSQIQENLAKGGINKHYRNYPSIGFNNWKEAYYGKENYRFLQKMKQKYDPENLIQHPQSVTA